LELILPKSARILHQVLLFAVYLFGLANLGLAPWRCLPNPRNGIASLRILFGSTIRAIKS
jgi:uncharacterized membrane protein YczE